jgi:hypothetical protein
VLRFFGKEKLGGKGVPFRWTGAQSFVVIPGIGPSARELRIEMSHGGRPPTAPVPVVEVAIGDRVLGTATPDGEIRSYAFALPADLIAAAAVQADPIRVRLRVPTWNPQALIGGNDARDLGVLLTRVEVR